MNQEVSISLLVDECPDTDDTDHDDDRGCDESYIDDVYDEKQEELAQVEVIYELCYERTVFFRKGWLPP